MTILKESHPHRVLGITRHADQESIRARYLELVREFPPEIDSEKFQAIQAAYDLLKDPLAYANHLINPPEDDTIRSLRSVVDPRG